MPLTSSSNKPEPEASPSIPREDEEEDEGDVPEETVDDEAGETTVVQDSGETSEGGKLKMIVQLLKRCLGVKDLAAMRLSLPASLLEPIPNLEYWQYLDRPDLFVAINDYEDELDRMLAVLRFTFTKDLKFIRGKVCKPYNSVLGEHFRSHWDIVPVEHPGDRSQFPIIRQHVMASQDSAGTNGNSSSSWSVFGRGGATADESTASFKSSKSGKRTSSILNFATARATPLPVSGPASPQASSAVESNLAAQVSNLSLGAATTASSSFESGDENGSGRENVRVAFLTEQISHHPPISAYWVSCPSRGLSLCGIDQISARVSGTGVRVVPGSQNQGIFVNIEEGNGKDERYQITHPAAMVCGLLKGSFYVTIGESTIVTCTGTPQEKDMGRERLRAIIDYKEEPWIGSPKFAVEGVIHAYTAGDTEHESWTKVKHVPKSAIRAYLDGSWRGQIRWRRASTSCNSESSTSLNSSNGNADNVLIDLSTLLVVPKKVRPIEKQHAFESRKLWESVTDRLMAREFGEATKNKQTIEQRQRDRAAERKRKGEVFTPTYFEKDISTGVPTLSAEGRRIVEEELACTDGTVH